MAWDDRAREVVFFGADRGNEDVVFRQNTFKIQQQFARSITLENAMKPEPLLAYALNGQPLDRESRLPAARDHAGLVRRGQREVAVGNPPAGEPLPRQLPGPLVPHDARRRRFRGRDRSADTQFVETEVTRLNLKSVIARVRRTAGTHQVLGFVLNDGTPLRSVEVKIDDGPWQRATLDPANTQFSWKLFTYRWDGATPGEHTLVSRVTDANGVVQPTAAELARKKTFLEDNSQFPRKVMVS